MVKKRCKANELQCVYITKKAEITKMPVGIVNQKIKSQHSINLATVFCNTNSIHGSQKILIRIFTVILLSHITQIPCRNIFNVL